MAETQVTIRNYLATPAVIKRVETLLDKRASQFTTSVLALASSDPKIMACEPGSLFNACLTAASLDLPINKNLGFAHIIPYKNNQRGITEAQFQMGWKGIVQLAQRSGQYKIINATEVYEGQLVSSDPLRGNVYDWSKKMSDEIVGYVGLFLLTNGFEHELFMSKQQMDAHAKRYSKAYGYDISSNKKLSPWSNDYDAMARKTVIKLVISKWGPMSIDMQNAIISDQAVIRDNGSEYIDGTDLLDGEKATDDQKAAIIAAHTGELDDLSEVDKKEIEESEKKGK